MSPVYAGTSEQTHRFQRQPNLPPLPTQPEQVLAYLASLDRAIVDFYGRLAERVQHFVEITDATAFGAADTVVTIAFNSALADATYAVTGTPSWNTKLWVTDLATTGFTLRVSDAPGGAGGTVRWIVVLGLEQVS
jgi:hypothetical protein